MKESTRKWIHNVAFTTFLAFFLISFCYVGLFTLVGDDLEGGGQTFFQFFSYLFGKLFFCIFPFCLCLGFANRMFERKTNRAVLRILHFFLVFLAYFIFMDLLFNHLFEDGEVPVGQIIRHTLPFFVCYPITVWVTHLGRAVFLPKEKKDFTSILD
ncbi:MAG: hypothetical protein IKD31_05295 [Clostridia bacterium]|nr:hypothetical protein [Clostridia bacterium]